jgi:hypothetical protein
MEAVSRRTAKESKLRLVLKRTSSSRHSSAAAVNALSATVDARALGSAAMDAPHWR